MKRTQMKPRKRKCRNPDCRQWFQPYNSMQTWCSPACGVVLAKAAQRKEQRRKDADIRDRLKTKRDVIKEAQKAFNWYIRERDYDLPCVSCGSSPNDDDLMTGTRWDAGHYRSTGANPELRFEELNIAKQCVRCNRDLSGNVVNFRIELRRRIGDDALAWLEGPHEPKRWTKEQLEHIRDEYRSKARALKRNRESGS